ncbi:glycosyltransferase [uncultured Microbulbifer sp.]|uniref:glycosyltransferase n=1 Tax=uncultured Microbulbifer sp. TaxID=348147 RepID=UPI0025FA9D74|nr:glycosyltransferase [uncultured Microbulbifer sp.]
MSFELKPSVIIPAHNEAATIGKLLKAIYPGVQSGKYTITVACNGCSDRTAGVVRHFFPQARCLDLARAGKARAINEAEAQGLGFPRIYVDADVYINQEALLALIDACRKSTDPVVVAPQGVLRNGDSDFFVKYYYRAWKKTRFFTEYGYGAGVYGLNRAARQSFSKFPDLISDDGYIRAIFGYSNIAVCEQAHSEVWVPGNFRDLLRIKTRSKLGKLQLAKRQECTVPAGTSTSRFTSRPSLVEWVVYYAVNALAYVNALRYRRRGARYRWHRDESSRGAT